MTWNLRDVVARRLEFVCAALARKEPLQRLCLAFGISRPTGYLWLKRYAAEGAEGLQDRPRGGGKRAVGRRRQAWEAAVLELRRAEPLRGRASCGRTCKSRRRARGCRGCARLRACCGSTDWWRRRGG